MEAGLRIIRQPPRKDDVQLGEFLGLAKVCIGDGIEILSLNEPLHHLCSSEQPSLAIPMVVERVCASAAPATSARRLRPRWVAAARHGILPMPP